MERVAEYSFSLNTSVLKIIGLYPSDTNKFLYKVYAYGMYISAMFPVTSLSILHFVLTRDLSNSNYNDFMMVAMVFYSLKFLPFVRKGDEIKRCIHYFDGKSFNVVEDEHKRILLECIGICRRNSRIFFTGCVVAACGFTGQAFLNLQQLPLNVWMPKVVKDKTIYYYTEFFLVILAAVYSALACGVVDPLIGGLVYQATAQLKILKENLQHMNPKEDEIYTKIKKCALHHQMILHFVKEYEICFSPVVFSQFAGSSLVIGVLCFQMSKMSTFDLSSLVMLNCSGCVFFQIFFYCYYGTLLTEENKTLSDAVYLSTWYEFDIRSQKALITLMEQSKKPMVVTAGKLFELSLETFTMILKRAYSLIAVLKDY